MAEEQMNRWEQRCRAIAKRGGMALGDLAKFLDALGGDRGTAPRPAAKKAAGKARTSPRDGGRDMISGREGHARPRPGAGSAPRGNRHPPSMQATRWRRDQRHTAPSSCRRVPDSRPPGCYATTRRLKAKNPD